MKYETPEMTALMPAIDAIQDIVTKPSQGNLDGKDNEATLAYADWE